MHCTAFDFSGDEVRDCGNEDFDVTVSAMLTADLSGEESDHIIELDGFSQDDVTVTCKRCGKRVEDADVAKAITILILKLEKRFGAKLKQAKSYTFEDGTVVYPEQLQVSELKDVSAGPAYQAALAHSQEYARWLQAQTQRVTAGEISAADLSVMRTVWRQGSEEHLATLLAELGA